MAKNRKRKAGHSSKPPQTKKPPGSKAGAVSEMPKDKRLSLRDLADAKCGILFHDGKYRMFGFADMDNLIYYLQRNIFMDWDNPIYKSLVERLAAAEAERIAQEKQKAEDSEAAIEDALQDDDDDTPDDDPEDDGDDPESEDHQEPGDGEDDEESDVDGDEESVDVVEETPEEKIARLEAALAAMNKETQAE